MASSVEISNDNSNMQQNLIGIKQHVNGQYYDTASVSTRVRVASIVPSLNEAGTFIEAVIVLFSPYSSKLQICSFLLAEHDDFNRQVQVVFHGSIAKDVAKKHPGIGDKVRLDLNGARVVREQPTLSIPGQTLDCVLHFERQVCVSIISPGAPEKIVKIDRSRSPSLESATVTPFRPRQWDDTTSIGPNLRRNSSIHHAPLSIDTSWLASPIKSNEYGFDSGRGSKRTKFARYSGQWRLAEEDEGSHDNSDISAIEQSHLDLRPYPVSRRNRDILPGLAPKNVLVATSNEEVQSADFGIHIDGNHLNSESLPTTIRLSGQDEESTPHSDVLEAPRPSAYHAQPELQTVLSTSPTVSDQDTNRIQASSSDRRNAPSETVAREAPEDSSLGAFDQRSSHASISSATESDAPPPQTSIKAFEPMDLDPEPLPSQHITATKEGFAHLTEDVEANPTSNAAVTTEALNRTTDPLVLGTTSPKPERPQLEFPAADASLSDHLSDGQKQSSSTPFGDTPEVTDDIATSWTHLANSLFTPEPSQTHRPPDHGTHQPIKQYVAPMTPMATQDRQNIVAVRHSNAEYSSDVEVAQMDGSKDQPHRIRRALTKPAVLDEICSTYSTPHKLTSKNDPSLIAKETFVFDPIDQSLSRYGSIRGEDTRSLQRSTGTEDLLEPEKLIEQPQSTTQEISAASTSSLHHVPLSNLTGYFGEIVDTMVLCVDNFSTVKQAVAGPRDWYTTGHVVDNSSPERSPSTVTVQILRPHKNAIPDVKKDDIILLHRFKVSTTKRKPMLSSTDSSSWAVYRADSSSDVGFSISVTGPPIEHGKQEAAMAASLAKWWRNASREKEQAAPASERLTRAAASKLQSQPNGPKTIASESPPDTTKDSSMSKPVLERGRKKRKPSLNLEPLKAIAPPFDDSTDMMPPPPSSPLSSFPTLIKSHDNSPSTRKNGKDRADRFTRSDETSSAASRANRQIPPLMSPAVSNDEGSPPMMSPFDENASVASIFSGSSRQRRYERRDTSLIHELRDGTQWVDIETSEVVSVSTDDSGDELDVIGEEEEGGRATILGPQTERVKRNDSPVLSPMVHSDSMHETGDSLGGRKVTPTDGGQGQDSITAKDKNGDDGLKDEPAHTASPLRHRLRDGKTYTE